MAFEHNLVYGLREKGSTEADVLQIVENMGDPQVSRIPPVKLDSRLVRIALSQYRAKEDLSKIKDYVKRDKEILAERLKSEEKRIRDTTENLLSVKILPREMIFYANSIGYSDLHCPNCEYHSGYFEYTAVITCLNQKGGIPVPIQKKINLFNHCNNCGYTKETENQDRDNRS